MVDSRPGRLRALALRRRSECGSLPAPEGASDGEETPGADGQARSSQYLAAWQAGGCDSPRRPARAPAAALLPAHIREVRVGRSSTLRRARRLVRLMLASQVRAGLREMPYWNGLNPCQRRLGGRLPRADDPCESRAARGFRIGQVPGHGPQASVQRQLADGRVPLQATGVDLPRRGKHRERDREIETRALLAQMRRCEGSP